MGLIKSLLSAADLSGLLILTDRKTDRVRRVKRKVGKGLEVIQSTASRNKYISGREGILDVNFQGP